MPLCGSSSEALVAKATLKTRTTLILGDATFTRHAVKSKMFSPSPRLREGFVPGLFQGEEKTCPTSKSQGPPILLYIELGSSGSNLTAPLSGMPRGESPLYQPPGHLGGSVAVAGVNRVRGSPDSRGPGGSSWPLGHLAAAASIPL